MNNNCPAFDKGRWYKVFIKDNSGTLQITTIDGPLSDSSISGNHLVLPEKFIVVDYLLIIDSSTISSATSFKKEIYKYANGKHSIGIAPSSLTNAQTAYIFGYFDGTVSAGGSGGSGGGGGNTPPVIIG